MNGSATSNSEEIDLKKFPKVRPVGHPETDPITEPGTVVVHEKMDGANFRFRRCGDRIIFGSRNTIYTNEKDIAKAFRHAVEFVRERVDVTTLGHDVTYFGEAMHKHTLEYDWDSVPSVLGFAVYDHKMGEFLPWENTNDEFELLDLPTVPVVDTLPGPDVTAEYDIPDSTYRDGIAEGVVFWHDNGTRAKLRSEEFKEKHDAPVAQPQDFEGHGVLVNQFCTETRIDKRINDLLDEGHALNRELMGKGLPQAVSRDILEEHADEIVSMNETVNLKDYRSLVAKRCLKRIDARVEESSSNEGGDS